MELLDSEGKPLVVGNRYIIKLRDHKFVEQLTQSDPNSLVTIFGHNEIVTFLDLYIVEGDTPTGTFKMKDGTTVTSNNFTSKFILCKDDSCSISGGKRRTRRTRRKRSRRFAY
jgi:hypothetical protein